MKVGGGGGPKANWSKKTGDWRLDVSFSLSSSFLLLLQCTQREGDEVEGQTRKEKKKKKKTLGKEKKKGAKL